MRHLIKKIVPISAVLLFAFSSTPAAAFVISNGGECCPSVTNECCEAETLCDGHACGPEEISPAPGTCRVTDTDRLIDGTSSCLNTEGEAVPDEAEGETAQEALPESTAPGPPIEPILAINIPTVTFSDVQVTAGEGYNYIDIPWLADYMSGVYRYAVFIGSVLAAVMFMIGGLQWLTAGGNAGRVDQAKTRIRDSVIGLVLILGSYLLLNTINPGLTSMQPLRVKVVQKDPLRVSMMTTTANTSDPDSSSSGGGGGGDRSFGGRTEPVSGSYTRTHTTCPISLSAEPARVLPNREGRTREFAQQIGNAVGGSDVRQKVVQIAEAAVACEVYFGSCGRTGGSIYALAGVSVGADNTGNDPSCLWADSNACGGTWGAIGGQANVNWPQLRTYRCQGGNTSNCGADAAAARAIALDNITGPAGYPDSLANILEPGDIMIIYNGNSSPAGSHTAIFLGWDTGGWAHVIDGDARRLIGYGRQCIRDSCGAQRRPLLWVHKPVCNDYNSRNHRCSDE